MAEKVIDYIAGIMRTGFGLRGSAVLGVGEVQTSENAMIITDKRVLFITAPIPGAEKIIASTDIPMWQWLAARKDIDNKTREMISSMSVEDIANSNPKNFWVEYSEIEKIDFGRLSRSIEIIKRDSKKLKYSIRDKADFEKAKTILKKFL